jgi:hypothetical protein
MNLIDKYPLLREFKWYIIVVIALSAIMAWYDLSGDRLFETSAQQKWSSSGPGYHK